MVPGCNENKNVWGTGALGCSVQLLFWAGTCTHHHQQGGNKERQSEPAVNSNCVTSAQGSVPHIFALH